MSTPGLFIIGTFVSLLLAFAMSLLIYAAILDGRDERLRRPGDRRVDRDILNVAFQSGGFSTLVTAIERAGLNRTLEGKGPFTVFAPSDEAFAKLPHGTVDALLADPATLTKILSYHVVPDRMSVADAARRSTAPTINGENLPLCTRAAIEVDGAHVLEGDIEASNGLIHVIDRVLLPAAI